MKRILIILCMAMISLYGQNDFGYNSKNVSNRTKSVVKRFEGKKRVEGEHMYRSAVRSKIYPIFKELIKVATVEDLIELTKHPNPITRYYAFMGLGSKKVGTDTLFQIVLSHILDTTTIQTQFGCIGGSSSMSENVISTYTFSRYINHKVSDLVTIDSLLEANNIYYRFYPLTPDSIRNQIRKSVQPDYTKWKYYELTRRSDNTYPLEMQVEGKIVDLSLGVSCGVLCGCGTIKVSLTKKIPNYEASEVLIAIHCNSIRPDWLNKNIKINVRALLPTNNECFWNGTPINLLDPGEIPFYIPYFNDQDWVIE